MLCSFHLKKYPQELYKKIVGTEILSHFITLFMCVLMTLLITKIE